MPQQLHGLHLAKALRRTRDAAGFLHVGTAVHLLLLLLPLVLLVLLLQPQTKTVATASQSAVVLSLFKKHTAGAMVPSLV
jgi:hypothetical protein